MVNDMGSPAEATRFFVVMWCSHPFDDVETECILVAIRAREFFRA